MKHFKRLAALLLAGVLALSVLTGCGGTSSQITTEKYESLVNTFLKADGLPTIKADSSLDQEAADYASIVKQYVAVSKGTSQSSASMKTNYAVDVDESAKLQKLRILKGNIAVRYIGVFENPEDDDDHESASTVERKARVLAWDINWLLTPVGTDGKRADQEVASEITGIGIAEVSDVNVPYWVDTDETDQNGNTVSIIESTRKFSGWIVVISYN